MNNSKADEIYFPKLNIDEDFNYIANHKVKDKPNYTIWITLENDDTTQTYSFDVNIYDEDNNERAEDFEVGHISDYYQASSKLQKIIEKHADINFIRISDKNNTY